jgi:hypothetical protein
MLPTLRIIRLSNTLKGSEEKHLEFAWTAIMQARRMLTDHPCPDTFLGRKTQEPFPSENVVQRRSQLNARLRPAG